MSSFVRPAFSRRRRRALAAALCLSVGALSWLTAGCASRPGKPPAAEATAGRGPAWPEPILPARVKVRLSTKGGPRVITLPLDEYVLGAVRAEVLPSTLRAAPANRALDVQAIVSRTYAAANLGRHAADGYDVCDTTHCQVYRAAAAGEGHDDAAARAVNATQGKVLTFQGRVIQALFHADCGGHTASAASVWGGVEAPYLESVDDWFCARRPASAWTFDAEEGRVVRALNADPRTRIGTRFRRVEVASRDASGRALAVTLIGSNTISVRAEVFRAVMTQAFGPRSIRSTWFEVAGDRSRLHFSGVGFGHGVGLCQGGALRRVEARQTPSEILAHYFPGTRLQSGLMGRVRPDVAERLFAR